MSMGLGSYLFLYFAQPGTVLHPWAVRAMCMAYAPAASSIWWPNVAVQVILQQCLAGPVASSPFPAEILRHTDEIMAPGWSADVEDLNSRNQ